MAAEGMDKNTLREDEKTQLDEKMEIEPRRIDISTRFDPVEVIKQGFINFKTNEFDKFPECFEQLAIAQNPKFLVFACSDSRVCPSRVLDFKPGQAFMARNIANMVPGFNQVSHSGSGAVIKYAVKALEVEVVLVIGHSKCGGIKALMKLHEEEAPSYDFINDWIKIGLPAKAKVMAEHPNASFVEKCSICEREAVNVSLINLLTYPYVRERVAKGTLKLMGGHYDFVEGKLQLWGFDCGITPLLCI